jgi:hypothetical protein
MKENVKIGEIKKALEHNKNLSKESNGKHGYPQSEDEWGVYDSSLDNFSGSFRTCLPNDIEREAGMQDLMFRKYIENTLSKGKNDSLTAVEFGGPGSKLFRGFSDDFFHKTVGVCLKDIRNQNTKETDRDNLHSVIEGDILDVQNTEVLEKVKQALSAEKVDLIMSRMIGPLQDIDHNSAILDRLIRNWYEMLNENGLMFIEYRNYNYASQTSVDHLIKEWSATLREKFPQVEIQVSNITDVMRLHKKFGAPQKLPSAPELYK